jgi:DNA invertase Pin-like site-specific DNA recombinase
MTVENQKPVLEDWLSRNSKPEKDSILWLEEQESTRNTRPVRENAIQLLRTGEYDTLLCTRLDRWGRSTIEIISSVMELIGKGSRIVFCQQGYDFSKDNEDPFAKNQFQIMASFAELERSLIRLRTLDGLERARKEGKTLGRPLGSKDKKVRRKSGYFLRYVKDKA